MPVDTLARKSTTKRKRLSKSRKTRTTATSAKWKVSIPVPKTSCHSPSASMTNHFPNFCQTMYQQIRAFGYSLCIYKGTHIADENLTINQLNEQVSAKIDVKSDKEIKIKASMKVREAEKLFKSTYGMTVQVKNPEGTICVPNGITIGQAARGEYK